MKETFGERFENLKNDRMMSKKVVYLLIYNIYTQRGIILEKLEQLLNNLQIIQSTHPEDACIILADTEKVIGYQPGKTIDLKIPVGALAENFKGTVTHNALISGKFQKEERGSEHFGIAYISTATPIIENNEVIGVISAVVSNHTVDVLRKGAESLTSISEELSAASEDMAKVSDRIANDLSELNKESALLKNEINKIKEILTIIKNTAVSSRILGLNASIEAARSGEHGRGFAVVANEIKKMADQNKETVDGFEPQLKDMMINLENIIETIQHISSNSQEQSAMMEEFHVSFDQIVNTASELSQQANSKH